MGIDDKDYERLKDIFVEQKDFTKTLILISEQSIQISNQGKILWWLMGIVASLLIYLIVK